MKKLYITMGILLLVSLVSGCKKAKELPPLNEGYATTIIVPEPVDLTVKDRQYLDNLEKEYKNSLKLKQ